MAGLACVLTHHRHPFEAQPRYCRTHAPRQSTSFRGSGGSGGAAALAAPDRHGSPRPSATADPPDAEVSRSAPLGGWLPGSGGATPDLLVREGRADQVHAYLDRIMAGGYA